MIASISLGFLLAGSLVGVLALVLFTILSFLPSDHFNDLDL